MKHSTPEQAERNYLKSVARWERTGLAADEERADYWRAEWLRHIEQMQVARAEARLWQDILR